MSKTSNIQKIYPLSPMQEGMLFHVLLEPTSAAYVTQTEMRVSGMVDAELMEKSLNKLIERHEILRTVFVYQQIQHIRQVVLKERKGTIRFENITHLPAAEQESYLLHDKQQDKQNGFDLSKDILFRMSILQTGEQAYRILITYHHIIMDGWCQGILFYELLQIYAAQRGGHTLQLEPTVPYSHYIDYLKKQDKEQALNFWSQHLMDYGQQATLPQKKRTSSPNEYQTVKHSFTLDERVTKQLNELAVRSQATLNTVMQAIWATILTTYSNTHDVVFGSVVSGRTPEVAGIEKMIGLTINTIPVRIQSHHPQSFQELVTSLQRQAFETEPYHYVPLYDIQSQTELKQGLFNHLFVFENYPMDVNLFGQAGAIGFTIEGAEIGEETNYDFNLIIVPGREMTITFNYNALAYEAELVSQIQQHLLQVIGAVTVDPGIGLHEIEMITASEKQQILFDFNDTQGEYPRDKTIPELFAEQAKRMPDEVAIMFQSEQLTYRELDKRSNQLAHVLRAKGVKRDDLVVVMMERSLDMVVAMLAVVKAGGAYVPIDPAYPAERMTHILEDCQARWILCQKHLADYLPNPQVNEHAAKAEVILLDHATLDQVRDDELSFINQPNDLVYVIYTSGSTGRPKGVMVQHRGVVRLIKHTNFIDFSQERCQLQTGSIAFDACTLEVWGALLNGLSLVLVPEHVLLDADQVKETIERHQVSVMFLTTALFAQLAQQNPETFAGLRTLLVGGDALSKQPVEKVLKKCPHLQLKNLYGPTENTVISTYFELDADVVDPIPIGRPIQNSTAYIVDQHMRLLPIGVAGELCVGGDGLARGYLNNRQMTEDKFIPNPFVTGERMYRTGDLARWRKDGTIEFLGRIDQQVKVRGYRIEPGEIEARLSSHEAIEEVLVVPRQDEANQTYLCAYLVSAYTWTLTELRAWVGQVLPDYMIPAAFVQLEAMPITINGKIDRKALPEPTGDMRSGMTYIEPQTDVEKQLAAIWHELLGVEKVGIHDDFFALGGHSLKATQLVSRIQKQFEVVFPLRDVFTISTLGEMAAQIMRQDTSQYVSIERVEREAYPITPAQKRVFVMQQLDPDSIHYNVPALLLIEGALDKARLQTAVQSLVNRHDALRTSFEKINDEWMQRILPVTEASEAHVPLMELQTGEKDIEQVVRDFIRPFDLSQAPLMRVGLIEHREGSYILVVDMHHIISDGTSLNTFTHELIQLYQGEELPKLRLQYTDYAVWLESWMQSEAYQKQEAYWLQAFAGELPVLELPTDYSRPLIQQFAGDLLEFELDEAQTQALHKLCADHGVTLYMTLLAAYFLLLHKYSGQEDIIVGTPVAGRNHADVQQMIGMFVNTLAIRSQPEKAKSFTAFLQEVKQNVIRAMEHQDYPLEELLHKLNGKRDVSRNPLFDVSFILQNMDQDAVEMADITLTPYSFNPKVAKFDLTLAAVERNGKLAFQLEYSTHLFQHESMQRMVEHFIQLVEAVCHDPKAVLGQISMISGQETELLLTRFNDTQAPYPRDQTIQELFSEQADRTPDAVAVMFGEKRLTYRQLDERSTRLAHVLRGKGVGPDAFVALMVERSLEMIVGMLGILKAGGAYVPIDPNYPAERIGYMLDDCRPRILLTQKAVMEELRASYPMEKQYENHVEILLLDELLAHDDSHGQDSAGSDHNRAENLAFIPYQNSPTDLAYVIYTSGSTGRPKGVMVEHRSIVRLVKNTNYINFSSERRILQTGAIVFDACTFEIWGALLNGLELVLVSDHVILDADRLQEAVEQYGITAMWLTSPLFNQLSSQNVDLFAGLKTLLVGGDALSRPHIERVRQRFPSLRLINGYGPTENTTFSTTYEIGEQVADPIPIGKPIQNSTAYILDDSLKLLPVGLVGELCVGGDGLARGYLNNGQLTAEKFVPHPYVPGERLYRTGDLARFLPDGNIEYLGRIDQQVKIRGYRIEPGEIEEQMLAHDRIQEAVVLPLRDESDQTYLCAYVVSDVEWTLSQLRQELGQALPEYMLPTAFVQVEKMPLTPNGKIDRKALPEPTGIMQSGTEYEAPINERERALADIWSKLLGIEQVGRRDHFFEIGGHSLKAMQLVSHIQKQFEVEFPLREVFLQPTLQQMAERLGTLGQQRYQKIEPVDERSFYPVSPAQKRMYVMQQFNPASTTYNIPYILNIQGALDIERLRLAAELMVNRHEAFRTSFEMVDETLLQRIHPSMGLSFDRISAQEHELAGLVADFIRPFDLTQAPLIRAGLISYGDEAHVLLIDMHHIISDGTSMSTFIEELIGLYEGEQLPPLRIHYKDYAVWLEDWRGTEACQKQERYWLQAFDNELPVLQLPTDYPRPSVRSFEGDRIGVKLSPELTAAIRNVAKETETTVFMVMLAAYTILLGKYSGQDDIVVGTPVAGRSHPDVDRMIGMFINTVALRNQPTGEKTFRQYVQEVRDRAILAFEHQDYPLEELIEKLELDRDVSRNPLFDTMFTMLNMDRATIQHDHLRITPYEYEYHISKFDLTLEAVEVDNQIALGIEYATKLFKADTIQRMAAHYQQILAQMTAVPDQTIASADLLTEAEKSMLHDLNQTTTEYPREKTIHQLFAEQAGNTPDRVAVTFGEMSYTYRELDERSSRLARVLREKGVGVDQPVAIMVEKSLELVIGMLAILKAGGAYVPVDPSYPNERIAYLLTDCQAKWMIVHKRTADRMAEASLQELVTDIDILLADDPKWDQEEGELLTEMSRLDSPGQLAYVIYTSGSTGRPKGVMVEHRNVVRLVKNTNIVDFSKERSVLQTGAAVFDACTFEVWGALLNGLELVLVPEMVILDAPLLQRAIKQHGISLMFLTTSLFHTLAQQDAAIFEGVQTLVVGGEALVYEHVKLVRATCPHVRVINGYGPTENTTFSTYYVVDEHTDDPIPIGKPLSNSTAYILDAQQKPVPIGVAGELYVGGDGVARGYLNQEELTRETFIQHPFALGERLYRTKDLARMRRDGNIEYLGRIDHQVKIRGYRIELGEIEAQLLRHEAITEAIVLAKRDRADQTVLCAYLVSDYEWTLSELRTYLVQTLPDYMLPSAFVQLESMPLTTNGKLDRNALPEPDHYTHSGAEYEAPIEQVEAELAEIWSSVLGIDRIGRNDHFFELGGHSLKAMQLVSRIQKHYQVDYSLRDVFVHPTLKEMAGQIDTLESRQHLGIEPAEERELYPVSSAQQRMYVVQQLDPSAVHYNIPAVMTVEGELDLDRLRKALGQMMERHEVFRTSFDMDGEALMQRIHPQVELPFAMIDARAQGIRLEQVVQNFIRPFDLHEAPLIRMALVVAEADRHVLLIDMHHIISDGTSMSTFTKELIGLYEGEEMPPLRIHYKDYAVWQQAWSKSQAYYDQESYWMETFADELPVLQLPTDHPRPAVQSFEGSRVSLSIDASVTEAIRTLAKDYGTTIYTVLLSAYNIMLSKYSGQEDIIVGTSVAGRSHADVQDLIGMFINTLALRNQPHGQKTVEQFIREVSERTIRAFGHQDYPLEELIQKLDLHRDMSRNPLFDTMFNLQNQEQARMQRDNLAFIPFEYEHQISKFDLTFQAAESADHLDMEIEYSTRLFEKETIQRMAGHYLHVLDQIVRKPQQLIADIELVQEAEREQLLRDFNETACGYPADKTIDQLFAEQVERTPDHVAVVYEDQQLTYRELNTQANHLAAVLHANGVETGQIVGLLTERSLEMIVGILAILKAGAAYLPIDPAYPQERIEYQLEDSGTRILLANSDTATISDRVQIIPIDRNTSNLATAAQDDFTATHQPSDLAYIIYTSGTTGLPKGVMIEHRNVVRLLFNEQNLFDFHDRDVWTMFHSYCFDFSVWEMYGALLYGGKLVIVPKAAAQDPKEFALLLAQEGVTIVNQTPTAFYGLSKEACSDRDEVLPLQVRYVIFGGEALMPAQLQAWRKTYPATKLINMYGITETTVHVTYKEITDTDIGRNLSNIGKPIPTLTAYVLDANRQLVPIGVAGELYVGGAGVARGYINRTQLTEERFVENPFATVPGEKMYRSGDLARWLPDGNMEYLGRIDTQVKIRGFRIELGEIEAQLLTHEHITETSVLAMKNEEGQPFLCAYVVANKEVTVSELRATLAERLPDYMIPSHFVQLDKMPLTPNGKLDRKALPQPDGRMSRGTEYEAPRTEQEVALACIWQEVLGIEQVGIVDNFFDLGGDSIKAIRLVARMEQPLGRKIQLRELYAHPTIKGLATEIRPEQSGKLDKIKEEVLAEIEALHMQIMGEETTKHMLPDDIEDVFPMSDIEKGMAYSSMKHPDEAVYHDQMVYQWQDASFDADALQQALHLLAEKHAILRSQFDFERFAEPVQLVRRRVEIPAEVHDLGGLHRSEQITFMMETLASDRQQPFDMEAAPLWRVKVFLLDGGEIHFALITHHSILDGWSVASLMTELTELYERCKTEQVRVSMLTCSYKDYVIEQRIVKRQTEVRDYWKNELEDYKRLQLPISKESSQPDEFTSVIHSFPDSMLPALQEWTKQNHTTIRSACLAAYFSALRMFVYEDRDLLAGFVENGRPLVEDGDKILGCFLNTVPFRMKLEPGTTWRQWVTHVHQKTIDMKTYGRLPLPDIMELVNEHSYSGNPFFDTLFNYVDFHILESIGSNLSAKADDTAHIGFGRTNTLFDVSVETTFNRFTIKIDSWSSELATRFIQFFECSLQLMLNHSDRAVNKQDLLSESEHERLLVEFNQTEAEVPKELTISQLFEQQAQLNPDQIAVVFEDEELSYAELNEEANQLARVLREKGVQPDTIVALMTGRSIEMIISILAIMKAGGAYLPIDPEYPSERIIYMLENSKASWLLTEREVAMGKLLELAKQDIELQAELIMLDDLLMHEEETDDLPSVNTAEDLAYVIYTSGSTGQPKGVMLEHRGIVNMNVFLQQQWGLSQHDRIVQFASASFDASVWEIFMALLTGASLYLVTKETILDVDRFSQFLAENDITLAMLPPTYAVHLEPSQAPSLRRLITGGSESTQDLVNKWGQHVVYTNAYGPTESTICATHWEFNPDTGHFAKSAVPIGKPITNTQIYIVNADMQLQPAGVPGELCIGGAGLARGYLHNPEMTRDKFIPNPFAPGERLYRTGDLATWLPDGNIEYLGRIDQQVKIRGYRIEPGEVEARLLAHEQISEAVVIPHQDGQGNQHLCAYYVSTSTTDLTVVDLRAHIGSQLPSYMIPSYFIRVPQMPLTTSGKIDRKALPKPDGQINTGRAYTMASNEIEEKLVQLWQELLGIEKIGTEDDFFELGGNSMLLLTLQSRIRIVFQAEIPLKTFLVKTTVQAQASMIQVKISSTP
ncbi:non-ribosomal peptide synthetase [Brevibacillus dissolubilis]|uniref:non-ribosomal peptide synthetase n=1 Tax=Brevibacillus dissolubilis TaxID=1844116 RepID=UPI0011169974|nr:non-ribosomal peptide synthetase [Brevibacillus dissolubilis]